MTRLQRYQKLKQNRLEGKFNGAPLHFRFPRLSNSIPVIQKGKEIMLLGGSGVGKSQLWLGFILMTIYHLIKFHNYKAKIFIFLLEDDFEMFEDRLFCAVLYMKFGIRLDVLTLNSMKENLTDADTESKFEEVDSTVEDILKSCVVVDNVFNATGIYKHLRTESAKLGTHIWEDKNFEYKKQDGSTYYETVKVYKEYRPDDPDLHCITIIDNLNNFAEERDTRLNKTLSIRESITRWTRDYARLQITKHWNWSVVNIMQTSLDYDKKEFDKFGHNITEKLEPTINALGDNKICSRDQHLILGIFSPARYGIHTYENYNIDRLDDNFRALIVLKSNFSTPNRKIPLYFDGVCSYYKELPLPDQMSEENYKKVETNQINHDKL